MAEDVRITAVAPRRFPRLRRRIPLGLCAVLGLALLIRGGVLVATPGALTGNVDNYRQLAENLLANGTFGTDHTPTAYRPPLYPLLLVGCVALGDAARIAIGVLHVVLGLATVALVWVLGATAGLSGSTGSTVGQANLRTGKQDVLAALQRPPIAMGRLLPAAQTCRKPNAPTSAPAWLPYSSRWTPSS